MRTKIAVGFVIGLLVLGSVPASAAVSNKATFESAGRQAAGLRVSLLPKASPAVQSRISASAAEAKKYLARCGRNCGLYSFLSKDLKSRFTKLNKQELNLLITLAFGEIAGASTASELAAVELQQLVQEKNTMVTLLTNMMATEHNTLTSVLQNIKP